MGKSGSNQKGFKTHLVELALLVLARPFGQAIQDLIGQFAPRGQGDRLAHWTRALVVALVDSLGADVAHDVSVLALMDRRVQDRPQADWTVERLPDGKWGQV